MFWVLTPIIRSSYNCNYSFWHWSTRSATVRSGCWVGTCRAACRNIVNRIQSHLVGQLLNLIHDARTYEYKKKFVIAISLGTWFSIILGVWTINIIKSWCLAVEYLVIGVNSNFSFNSAAINGSLNKRLCESMLYPCSLPTALELGWEVQQPIWNIKFFVAVMQNLSSWAVGAMWCHCLSRAFSAVWWCHVFQFSQWNWVVQNVLKHLVALAI